MPALMLEKEILCVMVGEVCRRRALSETQDECEVHEVVVGHVCSAFELRLFTDTHHTINV